MLQFIAEIRDDYSLAEQVQMALEGGAQWVQLHLPQADDAYVREVATDVIQLCRENGTILVLEDRTDLARELGLHGIHLTGATDQSATSVREQLGPEAIIGAAAGSVAAVRHLEDNDIDYAVVSPALVAEARATGCKLPLVIAGDFSADNVSSAMPAGASGMATGSKLMNAPDPVKAVSEIIRALRGE